MNSRSKECEEIIIVNRELFCKQRFSESKKVVSITKEGESEGERGHEARL